MSNRIIPLELQNIQKRLAPVQKTLTQNLSTIRNVTKQYQKTLDQLSRIDPFKKGQLEDLKKISNRLRSNKLSISFLVQSQSQIIPSTDSQKHSDDNTPKTNQKNKYQEELLWITISGNKLMMNNSIMCHTFNTGSDGVPSINHRLISHLISNPNETFSRKELIELNILREKEDKDFRTCLADMKFTNDYAKLFFDVTKDTIKLTTPITEETKQSKRIDYIELPKTKR